MVVAEERDPARVRFGSDSTSRMPRGLGASPSSISLSSCRSLVKTHFTCSCPSMQLTVQATKSTSLLRTCIWTQWVVNESGESAPEQ